MWTVHKHTIDLDNPDSYLVEMRGGGEILHVGSQNDKPTVWFRHDTNVQWDAYHRLTIVGTGHPAPSPAECKYLGTAITYGESLVWHVFEKV